MLPENPILLHATDALPAVNPSVHTGAHSPESKTSNLPLAPVAPSADINLKDPSLGPGAPEEQNTIASCACEAQFEPGVDHVHSLTESSSPVQLRSCIATGLPVEPQWASPQYVEHSAEPFEPRSYPVGHSDITPKSIKIQLVKKKLFEHM